MSVRSVLDLLQRTRFDSDHDADRTTTAALPFNCRSSSQEDFWLSEISGEDLTIMLARVPGFWIFSHSSMQHYRGEPIDVRRFGQELGVRYIVEGTLINREGNYRISIQLMDATNKQLLWADQPPRSSARGFGQSLACHAWGTLLGRGLLVCGKLAESLEVARDACRYDDKVYMPRILLRPSRLAQQGYCGGP